MISQKLISNNVKSSCKYILGHQIFREESSLESRSRVKFEDMFLKNSNILELDNQNNSTITYPMKNPPRKRLNGILVHPLKNLENNTWISRNNYARCKQPVAVEYNGDLKSKHTMEQKKKKDNLSPSEETLEKVAVDLSRELAKIFVEKPDYHLYRHDIIFENRIQNKVVTGAINYVQQIGLIRIYAHLRFVFVQLQLKSVEIEKEEGIIRIKFCCKGIGMLKMALEYLPKKLYKKENMANAAPLWLEAVSSYHVDEEGKIFRHVLDNKEEDKGKATISPVQTIREKVSKLREKAPLPSPAL